MSRLFAVLLLVAAGAMAQAPRSAVEAKVDALLKQMTIEEKAGQMTQVAIDVVTEGTAAGVNHKLDAKKLAEAIQKYHVGSILNVNGEAYTIDHWHDVLNGIQDEVEKSRLKVPVLYGIDSIHGATYTLGSVLFPNAIGMAATWNPELARRAGAVSAYQTRASGIPWTFYPVLDIGRQPLWPRMWETLGEDPYLATKLAEAYIDGLQGKDISAKDKVAACIKHYAGYSMPFNGKDRTPAILDERTLRQVVLPTYEAAARAGVPTAMINSGEISGVPGHANYHLLTEILKQEWGFKGFSVSDWEDIKRLHTRDRVAATPKEAVRMAVMAGVDMSMVPFDYTFYDLLLECVKDGSVPMARIDDAVRRILRVKVQLGLMERPRPDAAMKAAWDQPGFHQTNLEAAREVVTLLKNEGGVLPLTRGKKVLVTGPNADLLSTMNGGWSLTWQGDQERLFPKDKLTVYKAVRSAAVEGAVTYSAGTTWEKEVNLAETVAKARVADVVVAVIGEKSYCETPGNIEDLALDGAQVKLVEALKATGKPVVTVIVAGRPRVLRSIVKNSDAILMAYLPGNEGGRAISDVIYGAVNPSGKLPFSYPRNVNGFTTYDYKPLENTHDNPAGWEWPFGYGLSYTTFAYSDLKVSAPVMTKAGSVKITVNVKNTGNVSGKEVVQLYVSDLYRQVSPPNKELKGFKKVELQPGEVKSVEFELTGKDLAFVGLQNKWTLEPGDYKVRVAGLEGDFKLR